MSKIYTPYYIICFSLLILLTPSKIISQSYSYSPSKLYVHNLDTNSTDFGGIEILNTGNQNLNLNWRLQIVDTLIDSRFELCNSGICSLNLPISGVMPSITSGNIGWIKFHMYSGIATGTNTISYLLKNGSTTLDTMVFKIIVSAGATGLNETSNIKKISVFPNPTNDETFVNFNLINADVVTIRILNNVGQIIYQTVSSLNEGSNKVNIDTKQFAAGIYNVVISTENGTVTKKLSVIK